MLIKLICSTIYGSVAIAKAVASSRWNITIWFKAGRVVCGYILYLKKISDSNPLNSVQRGWNFAGSDFYNIYATGNQITLLISLGNIINMIGSWSFTYVFGLYLAYIAIYQLNSTFISIMIR